MQNIFVEIKELNLNIDTKALVDKILSKETIEKMLRESFPE